MRFAKFVFIGAGILGIVVIGPLYFLLGVLFIAAFVKTPPT